MKMRLQKFLAQAGLDSRRKSEELIKAGKVKVNGKVVTKMGAVVDSEKDVVESDSVKCKMQSAKLYFVLNKPAGYVCSRGSQKNEKTVYDLLPDHLKKKVWSVGRLDKDSEGLLLFTNDGELTQKLTHPKFEHEKEYILTFVQVFKHKDKKILEKGVVLDGKKTSPCKIYKIKGKKLNIILKEGRNRQIRRMFGQMGYRVEHLVRMRVGKLRLDNLRLGQFEQANKKDVL